MLLSQSTRRSRAFAPESNYSNGSRGSTPGPFAANARRLTPPLNNSTTTETAMPPGKSRSTVKLADREFRQLSETRPAKPARRTFKPIRLNAARFDQSWDRKRGAAIRLTAVLLQEDNGALQRRVCENA